MVSEESSPSAASHEARAAAVVALLNTRPHATPVLPDTLNDPSTASEVLAAFGQPVTAILAPDQVDRIRAVRADLVTVVTADSLESEAAGWARLMSDASDIAFRYVFSSPALARQQQVDGDPVIGRIVQDVAHLVSENAWSRVRICANGRCAHAFYDATRSRTQRWHSYEVCGNRTNVAAYRARQNGVRTGS